MGLFSFVKDAGKNLLGGKPTSAEIEKYLRDEFGERTWALKAAYENGTVRLAGVTDTIDTREQVILMAGNIKGVDNVNDTHLRVKLSDETLYRLGEVPPQPVPPADQPPAHQPEQLQSTFYTIKSGDSLSKIAKEFYGDPRKYPLIFEANKDVIKDANLIYPGQQIRIPKNV